MTEQWVSVSGCEEFYEVSTLGNVRRKNSDKNLKQRKERNGYMRVHLSCAGKSKYILVHRLVAESFIDNPNSYRTVNHKDENKQNNDVENLEWCDMTYQNEYGKGAVNRNLAKKKKILMYTKDGDFIREWDSIKSAADSLGLRKSSISCVCRGSHRYKSTGGYKFKFKEVI